MSSVVVSSPASPSHQLHHHQQAVVVYPSAEPTDSKIGLLSPAEPPADDPHNTGSPVCGSVITTNIHGARSHNSPLFVNSCSTSEAFAQSAYFQPAVNYGPRSVEQAKWTAYQTQLAAAHPFSSAFPPDPAAAVGAHWGYSHCAEMAELKAAAASQQQQQQQVILVKRKAFVENSRSLKKQLRRKIQHG